MPKVIVASTNPVKIQASQDGFTAMFPTDSFEFVGISVPSGVPDQPIGDAETLQGALNRAQNALNHLPDADYAIGIEGGLEPHGASFMAFAWVVILTRGRVGKAKTGAFFISDEIATLIHQGVELGHADDIVFGRSGSKQQGGSVGILTGDVMTRRTFYAPAVILALIPFKNPTLTFP